MFKLMVRFMVPLVILSAACKRHEDSLSTVGKADCGQVLEINPQTRIVLEGGLRSLSVRFESGKSDVWNTTASCLIERIPTGGAPAGQGSWQQPRTNIVTTFSQENGRAFSAATFYHRGTKLLIHQMTCDQPGFLDVRATLQQGKVVGPGQMLGTGTCAASLWLVPFESSVTAEDNSLTIRGEGELVMVLAVAEAGEHSEDISPRWNKACRLFDPGGGEHPDVVKVIYSLRKEVETGVDESPDSP